mmetsp:Transcript_18572/g.45626  ORF Transcript_18572/g.45626 Transcript_18572/m.45626 type:complete len:242 (+) Transcript_18572:201-926(+)|eukprot:CAMPEP_0206237342 /NCGR_PEP_ID=MMETSP0047_2-20121206/14215_1 /ASSEMBLY_ACC=CAM_ASM_000192 /TAXON_ID=195065 /ORGANISM="Chroomonas mesostigmatica_cf, Strain CCMP1168" /LENGTH=241 /DNA_ID=CAMNT_0053661773 /DNA_START=165 /DNA_END=890 /DNA_ORIENTATION=+
MGCFSFLMPGQDWQEASSKHGVIKVREGNISNNWKNLTPGEVKEISCVHPGLYLGSIHGAADIARLQRLGITHILNVAGRNIYDGKSTLFDEEIVCTLAQDKFKYKIKEIKDDMNARVINTFAETSPFIREGIAKGGCFVHCMMGVSRSTTMVVAYLMDTEKMSLDQAMKAVSTARRIAQPNTTFRQQLAKYEISVHGKKTPGAVKDSPPSTPPHSSKQQALHMMAGAVDIKTQQHNRGRV